MPEITEHTSQRERRAIEAERDTDELKKAEYMVQHIGEEFEGIISSVANFGMFIELPNTIEGMVHVSNMTDDYYHFDERQMAMIGERQAKVFRIGDPVEIKVINVDVDERMIDFQIVGMPLPKNERGQRPSRGKTIQANPRGKSSDKSKMIETIKATERNRNNVRVKINVIMGNKNKVIRNINHFTKIKVKIKRARRKITQQRGETQCQRKITRNTSRKS